MNKFFQVAMLFVISSICINGMIYSLAPIFTNSDISSGLLDIRLEQDDVVNFANQSEDTVKSGNPFEQALAFVGTLVASIPVLGDAVRALGGIGMLLQAILTFSTAYHRVLFLIFGGIEPLWTFLTWTILPVIYMIQLLSMIYVMAYAVAAVRGGAA